MNLTLYQRIGGKSTVQAAVNIFYEKFIPNPEVKPFFEGVSITNQVRIMQRFITIILKGNTHYDREQLRQAHRPLISKGLSDHHMDLFNQTMAETLKQLDIPIELIAEFIEVSESYRDDILVR